MFLGLQSNGGQYNASQDDQSGSMWSASALEDYLDTCKLEGFDGVSGSDRWEKILSQMRQISVYIMHTVQETIENKPGCFEWYGIDFMVDQRLNVWVLECNISPDLSMGTKVCGASIFMHLLVCPCVETDGTDCMVDMCITMWELECDCSSELECGHEGVCSLLVPCICDCGHSCGALNCSGLTFRYVTDIFPDILFCCEMFWKQNDVLIPSLFMIFCDVQILAGSI